MLMNTERAYRVHMVLAAVAMAVLVAVGWWLTGEEKTQRRLTVGGGEDVPLLVFYTTALATTPQLPLWSAAAAGDLDGVVRLDVRLWKKPDDLQSLLLAGKGDMWLGHVEGFARARAQGAPLRLVAVTGWRKFLVVTRETNVTSPGALDGRELPYAPAGSPAVPILDKLSGKNGWSVSYAPHEPRQLAMQVTRGAVNTALVPEPLATMLLNRNDELRVLFQLEDLYGEWTGGPPRIPLAGIAMHEKVLHEFPRTVRRLVEILIRHARLLAADPARTARVLPPAFQEQLPMQFLEESLQRDIILVRPARDVAPEIERYFEVAFPDLVSELADLERQLLWR